MSDLVDRHPIVSAMVIAFSFLSVAALISSSYAIGRAQGFSAGFELSERSYDSIRRSCER